LQGFLGDYGKGLLVNVTVQSLTPCKKLVRVEVEAAKVDETFEAVFKDFRREASLPGFRPGKVPREMLLRIYEKDIAEETKRKLIKETYRKAIEEQKLDVVTPPDIEEIQFSRGQPLVYNATLETAPEFELPEYKGLPVKREVRAVTEADVEKALNLLREQRATYEKRERPLQTGDIAVVNYQGTCDGRPITEIAPTAKGLTEQKDFWVQTQPDSFIPGFAAQLLGAKAGDRRTVTVDFPADFVTSQLAGRKGVYEVEVVEVKERVIPPLDDELAKGYGAENLAKLTDGVREDLENELKYKQKQALRDELLRTLLGRVTFDLPETAVTRETSNVVYDLVQENAKRGVSRQVIEQQKDQIYTIASQNAKERVKLQFLLQKIAEKEDIKVSTEEINQRLGYLAQLYQIPVGKVAKDLQKRDGLIEIYDQIMNQKVIKLLEDNARIEDVQPVTPLPAEAPAAPPG
jgi:trigger factor